MGRVVRYRDKPPRPLCQVELDSGERVLVMITGKSAGIIRVRLGGLLPTRAIWLSTDPHEIGAAFAPLDQPEQLLDVLRDRVLECTSVADVRDMVAAALEEAEVGRGRRPRADRLAGLERAARRARARGDHERLQQLNWRRTWLAMDPPANEEDPPIRWDPRHRHHVAAAQTVVNEYGAALSQGGAFADCMYRPASLLPYRKDDIERSMHFLLDILEGRLISPHVKPDDVPPDFAKTLRHGLNFLGGFLDVPPERIPTDPAANVEFGKRATGA